MIASRNREIVTHRIEIVIDRLVVSLFFIFLFADGHFGAGSVELKPFQFFVVVFAVVLRVLLHFVLKILS